MKASCFATIESSNHATTKSELPSAYFLSCFVLSVGKGTHFLHVRQTFCHNFCIWPHNSCIRMTLVNNYYRCLGELFHYYLLPREVKDNSFFSKIHGWKHATIEWHRPLNPLTSLTSLTPWTIIKMKAKRGICCQSVRNCTLRKASKMSTSRVDFAHSTWGLGKLLVRSLESSRVAFENFSCEFGGNFTSKSVQFLVKTAYFTIRR